MTTVKDLGRVITARDLLLLRTLVLARVLDGDQVKTIGGFSSVRRTNRRLLKLVRAGFLKRWFVGTAGGGQKALYGLSPQGTTLIGEPTQGLIPWKQDALITSSQFLAHQQAVNAVFIRARFHPLPVGFTCERWMNFREPLSPAGPLVPDAYFEIVQGGVIHPMFLEVDLGTESSTVWKRKVELYLKLAIGGEFRTNVSREALSGAHCVPFPKATRGDTKDGCEANRETLLVLDPGRTHCGGNPQFDMAAAGRKSEDTASMTHGEVRSRISERRGTGCKCCVFRPIA